MNVSWTPVNLSVVDHNTVHYSRVDSDRRRRQAVTGTVTFPASASSGVVSGLQEGQQYQFSVSVSLSVSRGQTFTSTPGTSLSQVHLADTVCVDKVRKFVFFTIRFESSANH